MPKTIYISVVSHAQEALIMENFRHPLDDLSDFKIKFCIIDNTGSNELKSFCKIKNYIYFCDGRLRGFGANHNKAFEITDPQADDIFIVCNPDIILEQTQVEGMINTFQANPYSFSNVTCYYDKKKTILSNPDRHFPCFLNFVFSILLKKRYHYGSNVNVEFPEWISGEFMLCQPDAYKQIGGFDEDYFLYVEDVDFCKRAQNANLKIYHDKAHFIIHETQMASRSIASKSFQLHLKSVLKFIYKHKIVCLIKNVTK